MKFLAGLSVGFLEVAAVGFARRDSRLSATNAFVRANMANVSVDDDFVASMDYAALACSADNKLKRPAVTANLSGTSCSFSQSAQEAWGTAKTDDNVYGVLFEEVTGEAVLLRVERQRATHLGDRFRGHLESIAPRKTFSLRLA